MGHNIIFNRLLLLLDYVTILLLQRLFVLIPIDTNQTYIDNYEAAMSLNGIQNSSRFTILP